MRTENIRTCCVFDQNFARTYLDSTKSLGHTSKTLHRRSVFEHSLDHTSKTLHRRCVCDCDCPHRKHCTGAIFSKIHLTTPRKTPQKRCGLKLLHRRCVLNRLDRPYIQNTAQAPCFGQTRSTLLGAPKTLHRRGVFDKLARPYIEKKTGY